MTSPMKLGLLGVAVVTVGAAGVWTMARPAAALPVVTVYKTPT